MWMAEWFFTDFLERAVAAARGTHHYAGADLGPVPAIDSNRADNVEKCGQRKHEREQHSEKQFRGDQFAHEVELQDKKNRQAPARAVSGFLVLPEAARHFS